MILFFRTNSKSFNFRWKSNLFALYRLEHDDNASEFLTFAIMWKIFEEHLFDCIKRVVEVLCRLKNKFVKRSNSRARIKESLRNNERQKNFIEAVNKIDETNIVLNIKSKDKYEKKFFFNRKKRYVIDLCAACDSNKYFIYFLCQWSNSQHDQRVFFEEDLQKNSTFYFFADQYFLHNSVYINTLYMIDQNKRHETKINVWRIKITSCKAFHIIVSDVRRFYKRLSRIRIDIEHEFEMLKERWKSLIELRFRIRDLKSYIFAVRWIIACMMLHNMTEREKKNDEHSTKRMFMKKKRNISMINN